MGMALLANLAAYDFGYIPAEVLVSRTTSAFDTMDKLERHRGHFYNWYDTRTLAPLLPRYVSTVDSGNLSAPSAHPQAGPAGASRSSGDRAGRLCRARRHDAGADRRDRPGAPRRCDRARERDRCGDRLAAGHRGRGAAALTRLAPRRRRAGGPARASAADGDAPVPRWARALARQAAAPRRGAGLAGAAGRCRGDPLAPPLVQRSPRCPPPVVESARHRIEPITRLAERAGEFSEVEYEFLYDRTRHLLAIGYNVAERRRDASFYDLLASEARLTSYLAIAEGRLPQDSWFALGRMLASAGGRAGAALLGRLDVRVPDAAAGHADLREHAARSDLPRRGPAADRIRRTRAAFPGACPSRATSPSTGSSTTSIAPSACPGLGLKRGLAEDLVVAPYATVLALMVAPEPACENLQRLARDGVAGTYGFYEAVDYTPSRFPGGSRARWSAPTWRTTRG